LIKNGYSVAIVDQVGENQLHAHHDRKLSRIITPGTMLEDIDAESFDNNFLLSIYIPIDKKNSSKVGLAWIDISTGEFIMSKSNLSSLSSEITRIQVNDK
jgi:DNA mismatch repair protein MutS